MSSRRQRNIPIGGRYRQVSLHSCLVGMRQPISWYIRGLMYLISFIRYTETYCPQIFVLGKLRHRKINIFGVSVDLSGLAILSTLGQKRFIQNARHWSIVYARNSSRWHTKNDRSQMVTFKRLAKFCNWCGAYFYHLRPQLPTCIYRSLLISLSRDFISLPWTVAISLYLRNKITYASKIASRHKKSSCALSDSRVRKHLSFLYICW